MKQGPVELGTDAEEGESESKVISQTFGHLQHPKNEVRYLENIFFQTLKAFFPMRGCFFFYKSYESKYHSIYKNENLFCPQQTYPFTHALTSVKFPGLELRLYKKMINIRYGYNLHLIPLNSSLCWKL